MAEKNSAEQDDYEAFERELEAVLALDPTERINRYERLAQDLASELED